jgi:hypothetical protein
MYSEVLSRKAHRLRQDQKLAVCDNVIPLLEFTDYKPIMKRLRKMRMSRPPFDKTKALRFWQMLRSKNYRASWCRARMHWFNYRYEARSMQETSVQEMVDKALLSVQRFYETDSYVTKYVHFEEELAALKTDATMFAPVSG